MKIIITGATGFIGRNLATHFQRSGHTVVATGRSESIGRELVAEGIAFRAADITRADQVHAAFEPADLVIHCAGKAGDWGRDEEFYQTNVLGTRNVAAAGLQHGISRIVFISTPSVYYNGRDRLNIQEADPLPRHQANAYARTKLHAEGELLEGEREGLRTIILRPRAVFGPHDRIIVPRILRMSEKPKLPLINGGRALVDLTYIDNLIVAVDACLNAPDPAWQQVYNVSNGDPITIRDWFRQVLEVFGRELRPKNVPLPVALAMGIAMETASRLPFGPDKPLMTRFSVGYMARSMTMSLEKIKRLLDYQPVVGNQESFVRYATWYKQATADTRN